MKSLYILLLVGVVLLTGCDPVASDNRLIEVPAATLQRNVLIEDFTGQRCIFCPAATEAITQLQARYSADKLIAGCDQRRLGHRADTLSQTCATGKNYLYAPRWHCCRESVGGSILL